MPLNVSAASSPPRPDKNSVLLTPEEFNLAVQVALLRNRDALLQGRSDSVGAKSWMDHLRVHCLGACAEIAVGKYLNVYASLHVNQYRGMQSDLPGGIEVRWSSTGKLKVRENDPNDRHYYLVKGEPPSMTICGCIKGEDAKYDWWLDDPGDRGKPAYWVPESALVSVEREEG